METYTAIIFVPFPSNNKPVKLIGYVDGETRHGRMEYLIQISNCIPPQPFEDSLRLKLI